jgi:hypothetical protein
LLRDLERARQHLLIGHHLVDESPGERLLGRQIAIEQQQLHGALESEHAWQQEGGAGIGCQPRLGVSEVELRAAPAQREIRHGHQPHARARRRAIHGGNDRRVHAYQA